MAMTDDGKVFLSLLKKQRKVTVHDLYARGLTPRRAEQAINWFRERRKIASTPKVMPGPSGENRVCAVYQLATNKQMGFAWRGEGEDLWKALRMGSQPRRNRKPSRVHKLRGED